MPRLISDETIEKHNSGHSFTEVPATGLNVTAVTSRSTLMNTT